HPILAMIETATGIGPDRFMSPQGRAEYLEAAAIERRHKGEIHQLYDRERQSRWQGDELTSDEVRRIAPMQQTLTSLHRPQCSLRERGAERESVVRPTAACRHRIYRGRRFCSQGTPRAMTRHHPQC